MLRVLTRRFCNVTCFVQRLQNPRRRHRHVRHAHARRVGYRVADRSKRRHDRRLTDTANPVRVIRVGDLEDLRVDERQVGADRNPVVQEPRVLQQPVVTVDVFLVQRPANALRGTTLELPFDIVRVNPFRRGTRVLPGCRP